MDALIIIPVWLATLVLATLMTGYLAGKNRRESIVALYVFYLTISQVLATKIANFWVFSAPAAVFVFPFTFQLTDSMNEHFGRKETLKMVAIGLATQLLLVVFLFLATNFDPAASWLFLGEEEVYWDSFFSQSIRITAASLISFVLSETSDAYIFAKFKELTKGAHLWARNVISDVPTLALDSILFVWIVFGGVLPDFVVWEIVLGQIATKWFFGLLDTPFVYFERKVCEFSKNR
jgi:hypothetical protein